MSSSTPHPTQALEAVARRLAGRAWTRLAESVQTTLRGHEQPHRFALLARWSVEEACAESEEPRRDDLRRITQRSLWRVRAAERFIARAVELRRDFAVMATPDACPTEPAQRERILLDLVRMPDHCGGIDEPTFVRLRETVERFERSVQPTTLHYLMHTARGTDARIEAFLRTQALDDSTFLSWLDERLAPRPKSDVRARMFEVLGTDVLRTFPMERLARMLLFFHEWHDIVRFYQDADYRDSCPVDVQTQAFELYQRLRARIDRDWKTRLASVDPEDAAQETVRRLVEGRFGTYRYESDLLHYLIEVGMDQLRRHYGRPRGQELAEDEPIEDPSPPIESVAGARDQLQQLEALARTLVEQKFTKRNWPIAHRLLDELVLEAKGRLVPQDGPALVASDEELVRDIEEATGRRVSISNLRVIRSRLRAGLQSELDQWESER